MAEADSKPSEQFFVRPILQVRDVAASIPYYCDKLGFAKRWEHGDPLIIAGIERAELSLILDSASAIPRPATPSVITVTLHRPETLGDLHRDLAARGARILQAPFPTVWQPSIYQFDVEDLDGNILVFWGAKPASAP
jgi:hypothetical protein